MTLFPTAVLLAMGMCSASLAARPTAGPNRLGQEPQDPASNEPQAASKGEESIEAPASDLASMSLEELMNVEVSVASRHSEKLLDAPAAVYVITGDELRRSGHTSIQEALRMVPGFHVARWRTQGWDVTARGFTGGLSSFNQSFANQLLLMVDGVSLYSPLMAGIWWPLLDVQLDDVDRIEIIRGPSGTLWGTNAMNGVINVITKHTNDTRGQHVNTTVQRSESSLDYRYGGQMGESGSFRSWFSASYVPSLPEQSYAAWSIGSVGFRGDWSLAENERTNLTGTFYGSRFGVEYEEGVEESKTGGFLSAMWELGDDDDMQRLHGSFWVDRQTLPTTGFPDYTQDIQTFDLEYTRRRALSETNALSLGVGLHIVQSDAGSDHGYLDFEPEFRRQWSVRAFAQDELMIDALDSKLVAGIQAEESTFGGFQVQPNVRWLWKAAESATLWAAVSRAVRTPSLEERDQRQYPDATSPAFFTGNDEFKSERVLAHELGVRKQFDESLAIDLTGFYNDYDDLQTFEELDPTTTTYGNKAHAHAIGAEVAIDAELTPRWRLRSAYSYFDMEFGADPDSDSASTIEERNDLIPKNRANLRSYYSLSEKWELDSGVYWVDRLGYFDIDSYWRVDVRVGYHPSPHTEFSFGIQNLTDPVHPEADEIEIPRNIFFTLRADF